MPRGLRVSSNENGEKKNKTSRRGNEFQTRKMKTNPTVYQKFQDENEW
jgi:hypothetical protein